MNTSNPHKGTLIVPLAISVVSSTLATLLILARSTMIDYAIDKSSSLFKSVLVFVGMFLTVSLLNIISDHGLESSCLKEGRKLDDERMHHCSRLPYSFLQSTAFAQMNDQASQAQELDSTARKMLASLVKDSVLLLSSLILVATVSLSAAASMLLAISLELLVNKILIKRTGGLWSEYRKNILKADYLSSMLLDRDFSQERKVFGYNDEIETRFKEEWKKGNAKNTCLGLLRLSLESLAGIIDAAFAVLLLILLLPLLISNSITFGLYISFFTASLSMLRANERILSAIHDYSTSKEKMASYGSLMNAAEEAEPDSGIELNSFESLEFSHVSFAYPEAGRPILSDVSFVMEKGQSYALVGENGSGKTTIGKLMLRLFSPSSGQIKVNGLDLASYSSNSLRKAFGSVFQDFFAYPLTIRENITAGKSLEEEDVQEVVADLDLASRVRQLPLGLDTSMMLLKEGSTSLSKGQWQKLAIARCILSECSLAILDEPNSSLDPIVEAAVYEAYKGMLSDKASLFISHRLGFVRKAKNILVLKEGRIVACGDHDRLMQDCSYYNEMFSKQKAQYEKQ
jgi:ATP-binding cassette subfamily B protein